jgi:hypothetical protein
VLPVCLLAFSLVVFLSYHTFQGKVVFPDNKMFKTLADAWDLPKFKFMLFVIDGKFVI